MLVGTFMWVDCGFLNSFGDILESVELGGVLLRGVGRESMDSLWAGDPDLPPPPRGSLANPTRVLEKADWGSSLLGRSLGHRKVAMGDPRKKPQASEMGEGLGQSL